MDVAREQEADREIWDEEDNTFDGWDDEGAVPTRALFPGDEDRTFSSADEALEHAKSQGCDLRALVKRLQLDSWQLIRLINYIRRPTTSPRPTPESVSYTHLRAHET